MVVLTKENAERKIAGLVIRKAAPEKGMGAFIILYGQGGAGKTSLAAEIRAFGKTLLMDAEGGSDVLDDLKDDPNLDIVDVKTYKQFKDLCDALERDSNEYDCYIVDNLSEIDQLCEDYMGIVGNDSHDLSRYKLVTREIIRKVKLLRNLAREHGKIVVICLWDADEKDERNVLKKDLFLTPALRKELPGICTIIGHIRVLIDPNQRLLDFAPSPKTVSKFKRSRNSAAQKVPFQIKYGVDNLPLADVLNTILKGVDWPAKNYAKVAEEKDSE